MTIANDACSRTAADGIIAFILPMVSPADDTWPLTIKVACDVGTKNSRYL